jgi:hypothetical protein
MAVSLGAERTRLAGPACRAGRKQAFVPAITGQAEREFLPLARAYSAQQKALVLLLDQMCQHKSMGKKNRAKLADLICSTVLDLLAEEEDAELKEIYNRHSGGDFDAEEAEGEAMFKDMVEDLFGVEMDGDGVILSTASPDSAAPGHAKPR